MKNALVLASFFLFSGWDSAPVGMKYHWKECVKAVQGILHSDFQHKRWMKSRTYDLLICGESNENCSMLSSLKEIKRNSASESAFWYIETSEGKVSCEVKWKSFFIGGEEFAITYTWTLLTKLWIDVESVVLKDMWYELKKKGKRTIILKLWIFSFSFHFTDQEICWILEDMLNKKDIVPIPWIGVTTFTLQE